MAAEDGTEGHTMQHEDPQGGKGGRGGYSYHGNDYFLNIPFVIESLW